MNWLTLMQLCHAISLALFVHSFFMIADSSSIIPISFTANDYNQHNNNNNDNHNNNIMVNANDVSGGNNSWTPGEQHIIGGHQTPGAGNRSTTTCPQQCACLYALSDYSIEPLRRVNCTTGALPKHIPFDTESLYITNHTLDTLPVDTFASLHHLQELNLTHNGVNHLGRGHVFNNLSHLKVLDLSHNNLRQLFAGVFRGLRRLQALFVTDCSLRYLDEHTFDGLEMLNELVMSYNQISSIYLELFQSISNLMTLNLEHNHISHLTGGIFTSMTTLRKLQLSHNKIIAINDNAFVGLDMLEELHVEDNSLVRVPAIALQSLKRIAIIRMDNNPIQQITTGDFGHLPANTISLTRCPHMTLIDRYAFWDLPNLYSLALHSNPRLAFIDGQAFVGLPLLQSVELYGCGLKTIQYDIVHNILGNGFTNGAIGGVGANGGSGRQHSTATAAVEHHSKRRSIAASLMGNPFVCDCNVKYLYECLIDQHNCSLSIESPERVVCAEPPALNGTQISRLNITAIADECGPRLVAVNDPNVTVHKKIGDRHQFQCRALGVPQPRIHWILPTGQVLNGSSNTVHYLFKPAGSLALFHLKPRDSGAYKCVAENMYGSVGVSMTLMIDNIDLHLYPLTIAANYVTLVWNGTGRNSFHEYQIIYKVIDETSATTPVPTAAALDSNSTDNNTTTAAANGTLAVDSAMKYRYETVTVNHMLRSYSLTHLVPNTKYWICLTVKDADAHNGYVQLSCTTVVTKPATHTTAKAPLAAAGAAARESTNFAVAISISVTILVVLFMYFVYMGLKRYRIHRQYEIPVPKLTAANPCPQSDHNLPHIPLENIKSPLIKHTRH